MIKPGAHEPGDRIGDEVTDVDCERLSSTLRDLADFIDMAREVTSRTRTAYDADITLGLAGEAIVTRVGEAVGRSPRSVQTSASGGALAKHQGCQESDLRRVPPD